MLEGDVTLRQTTGPGRRGSGFYIGRHPEAIDAELSAAMRGLRHLVERRATGESCTIFTGSQAAMRRIQNDAPRPGQDMAIEIIELASHLYNQGNAVTVR